MNQKRILVITAVYFLITSFNFAQTLGSESFVLKTGDLLFQDLDGGRLSEAIETVTQGINNSHFTHIGVAARDSLNNIIVLEAVLEGVKYTPLKEFLNRSHDKNGKPKVLVGRIIPEYNYLIEPAINRAAKLLGKSYDNVFDINNDSYYCSELVYYSFFDENKNEYLFDLAPMTFNDPATGKTFEGWEKYFKELNIPVPEGKPGINPGGISLSDKINIVHKYGTPDGFTE